MKARERESENFMIREAINDSSVTGGDEEGDEMPVVSRTNSRGGLHIIHVIKLHGTNIGGQARLPAIYKTSRRLPRQVESIPRLAHPNPQNFKPWLSM